MFRFIKSYIRKLRIIIHSIIVFIRIGLRLEELEKLRSGERYTCRYRFGSTCIGFRFPALVTAPASEFPSHSDHRHRLRRSVHIGGKLLLTCWVRLISSFNKINIFLTLHFFKLQFYFCKINKINRFK